MTDNDSGWVLDGSVPSDMTWDLAANEVSETEEAGYCVNRKSDDGATSPQVGGYPCYERRSLPVLRTHRGNCA